MGSRRHQSSNQDRNYTLFGRGRGVFALFLGSGDVASGSSASSPRTVIRSGDSSLRRPSVPMASV